jgi:hypothetical protein
MRKNSKARFVAALLAAGALAVGAASAQAQTYPRVTGSGENLMIDYGPMGQPTALVGGGRVTVTPMAGENFMVLHLDSMFTQEARPGFVPVVIGEGDNRSVIYVPQAMADQMRARMGARR